jgi:acetolactate synthase-1/2/3 large subunit
MTGAETLVETLLASGVDVCFANPGTSEMHFVAALDRHPDMRCVLCLFEGGVTGAADGYARMSGRPAATLLHLGPGFGNGWANLHNARKAHSPIVNVVGDHAGYHLQYDAPLTSDLDGVTGSVSHWVRRSASADDLAADGAAAVRAALSSGGQIATLILPADASWSQTATPPARAEAPPACTLPDAARIAAAARRLTEPGAALLLSGLAAHAPLTEVAGRIAARTGCRLIAPQPVPRLARGAGAVVVDVVPYPVAAATAFLADVSSITCIGAPPPVSFFAYPGKPSTPEAPGTVIDRLCPPEWDIAGTLDRLAEAAGVDGSEQVARYPEALPDAATGTLDATKVGIELARAMPSGAILVNESVTAAWAINPIMDTARAHDRTNIAGGSIGQGLPGSIGCAIACPDRPVFAVIGDGSAMYQTQCLWTAAREGLDITYVILANGGYQILHKELENLGAGPAGRNARAMFDIADPSLDWVALAAGHGVPGTRADTAEALSAAFARARDTKGPFLIEAAL